MRNAAERTMRDTRGPCHVSEDILAAANAWRARDADAVVAAGKPLGVQLALPELAALEPALAELLHTDVISAIRAAVEVGVGHATATQPRFVTEPHHVHCLAVQTDTHVVVAIKRVETGRSTLLLAWPQLGTWSRVAAAATSASARRWALGDGDGRVRIPLANASGADRPRHDPVGILAQLAERPDDRDLRDILGDVWAESGDPRGEMIALERELEVAPGRAAELRARIEGLALANRALIAGDIALHATAYSADSWHVRAVAMSAARFR